MTEMIKSPLVTNVQKTLAMLGIPWNTTILAGISGGADSMVMLAVLKILGYKVSATHINFQLRGAESDGDALHVRDWCSGNEIPYLEYVIDTNQYSKVHHLNTQLAARKIRYDWWQSLIEQGHGEYIATAHHHDDAIETLFINLLRGTGIKGISGIPPKRDFFIRPLIHVTRAEIENFAHTFYIPFRTDRSNLSDDYLRNEIRHHLIPRIRQFSVSNGPLLEHSVERFRLEWSAWEHARKLWQDTFVKEKNHGTEIILDHDEYPFMLRWLEEKGIPWSLSRDYVYATDARKGNSLQYEGHELSRIDGGFFYSEIQLAGAPLEIKSPGVYNLHGNEFSIQRLPAHAFEINEDASIVFVSPSSVNWPLLIRHVQPGDQFHPFGMHGQSKKLQDFLVDLKLPVHEKKNVRVVTSNGKIIWVAGFRLDESTRVDLATEQEIYKMTFRVKV